MTARFLVADVFEGIASLPDNSVDLVVTSPPFLALRSYLPADHPDKHKELGSEPTPAAFIDALLDVVEALDRVLAPHGSIAIELGDTYANQVPGGNAYGAGPSSMTAKIGNTQQWNGGESVPTLGKIGNGWPQAKSLCLIPESFRWALVYGRNPFNGRETPQWRARNVVRWCRPNPPVGALGDKFRPATTDIVIACKSDKRYFDLDAVRTEPQVQMGRNVAGNNIKGSDGSSFRFAERVDSNPAGAPPLDFWVIPTAPFSGAHYATYPPDLCVRPIKAMCPERVCLTCGEPSRRIVDISYVDANGKPAPGGKWESGISNGKGAHSNKQETRTTTTTTTLGWTDCGHNAWRSGVVLDPFAGSGTTLAVATGHGRDAIGFDLDSRNADLAMQRVGMFLEVSSLGDDNSRIAG